MRNYLFLSAVLLLMLSTFQTVSNASELFGNIVKFQGTINVIRDNTQKPVLVDKAQFPVYTNDIMISADKSKAFIKLTDRSKLVILSKTRLVFRNLKLVEITMGKIIMDIIHQGTRKIKNRFRIKTATTLVGVKGTRFMINSYDQTAHVFLKSGDLTVEAIEGNFRRFVKRTEEEFDKSIAKEEKEFDDFINKEEKEFDSFINKQEKEFEEFVQQFEMKSGQSIVISGQEVRSIKIPEEVNKEFEMLDDW